MPLHNEKIGELSDQLTQKVDILLPVLQKVPVVWARARPVDELWMTGSCLGGGGGGGGRGSCMGYEGQYKYTLHSQKYAWCWPNG